MRICAIDNQVILYVEGLGDIKELEKRLSTLDVKDLPEGDVSNLLAKVNSCPGLNATHDEKTPLKDLTYLDVKEYEDEIGRLDREWIKERKAKGEPPYGGEEK